MRKRIPAPVITLIGLILPVLFLSCGFGRSLPTRNYYVLSYTVPSSNPSAAKRAYSYSLQVDRFNVQRVYNRQNIVYRFAPQELKWYEYQQWAVRPDYMVTDLVLNHLGTVGLFNRVSQEALDARADFRLEGTVEALEKFDAGDVFYGHLAMSFRMVRVEDGQQVWEYSFDERKQVYQREMVYTVIALSQIMQSQMNIVVSQLDTMLAALNGAPAANGQPAVTAPVPRTAEPDTAGVASPNKGYEIIPESKIRRR